MKFEILPTIDTMLELYEKPRSIERFQEYISILQGTTKDLVVPIAGFNPMAKEHLLNRLAALKDMKAEALMQDVIDEMNLEQRNEPDLKVIKVALNLADDLKGGWTNRYTTDYDSKFKINAIVKRNFCTPLLWASEPFSEMLIRRRTLEYVMRTIYWQANTNPKTLKEHIDQEIFVAKKRNYESEIINSTEFEILDNFYSKYKHADEYSLVFNFLYGDNASKSLAFPVYGISERLNGFDYAKIRAIL